MAEAKYSVVNDLTSGSSQRLDQFEQWARRAHETTIAELRQRPLLPMNAETYVANYVEQFRGYFEEHRRQPPTP